MKEPKLPDDIDSGKYPDALEYVIISPDSDRRIRPKKGFSFEGSPFYFSADWRIRAVGGTLYVEWNNAGTWEEQGRFETA